MLEVERFVICYLSTELLFQEELPSLPCLVTDMFQYVMVYGAVCLMRDKQYMGFTSLPCNNEIYMLFSLRTFQGEPLDLVIFSY